MKNELCHYCDLSGFKAIIENQTLWLSDLHYMNDSSEESLFLDALTDVMRNFRNTLYNATKTYLDNDSFMNSFFTNIKSRYTNMSYICCFTNEKNDDLSQWRGYADDGRGLCIGFKKRFIIKLSENEKIRKTSLIGSNDIENTSHIFAQKEICYSNKERIMTELEEKLKPIIDEYNSADKETLTPPFPDSVFTINLYEKTHNYKAFYKNESFKNEKEYRICFFDKLHENAIGKADDALIDNMQSTYGFNDNIILSELKYREGRGRFIPYRVMTFPKEYFAEMLSSITIGPKNPMSENEVRYFLLSNGFDTSNITIKKSASTYQ